MSMLNQRRFRLRARTGHLRRVTPSSVRRGYTLPELLVVLGIVGVMGAIAVPRIETAPYRMDGAARGSMAALVAAQRQAVKGQHDVIVAFDTATARILVHEDVDNDGEADAGERSRWVVLDAGTRFGRGGAPARAGDDAVVSFRGTLDGMPAVRFSRSGSASEEGRFYLTSERALLGDAFAEDTRAVEVERATGRVTWHEFAPPAWQQGF